MKTHLYSLPKRLNSLKKRYTGYNWNSKEMILYKKQWMIDSLIPLPLTTYENSYHDYWLYHDFYYKDTKEIIHTWTRPENGEVTTFAFIGISKEENSENYKYINKDFWYLENKKQIKKI
jgi:hypothetical protein